MVPQRTWAHSFGVSAGAKERRDLYLHSVTHSRETLEKAHRTRDLPGLCHCGTCSVCLCGSLESNSICSL